jgi:hypothetical protein
MFKRAFNPHPVYVHLGDAKSYIERKGKSLHGVAANNSRDPVDVGMVDSLTQNANASNENPSYVSVMDYVDVNGDPAETNRLFMHLNPAFRDLDDETPSTGGFLATAGLFFTNLAEIGLTFGVRGGLTVLTGTFYLIARTPGLVFGKPWNDAVDRIFDRIERGITNAHTWLSSKIGVGRFKEARYAEYSPDMQKVHSPQSRYASGAHVFNGQAVGGFIANGVGSILTAVVVNPWNAARKFITNQDGYRDDTLDKRFKPRAYHERKIKAFKQQAIANYKKAMNEKSAKAGEASQKNTGGLPANIKMRRGVQPWARNEYSTPLEFFDEIVTGLADVILSPMFRHNPGFAAIFFVFAHASFGVMAAPGMVPGTSGSNHVLLMISKLVAKDFMGKTVGHAEGASLASDTFTAFLNFKLPMILTEGIKEMTFGEYSQYILAHPEKITTGALVFSAFMGATYALSFLPQLRLPEMLPESLTHVNVPTPMGSMPTVSLPIPPMQVLDIFVEEAAEVQAHGLWPLTSIEFGFLALKLGLLVKGMASSSHDPAEEKQRQEALALIGGADKQKELLRRMMEKLKALNEQNTHPRGIKDLSEEETLELLIKPALKEMGVPEGEVQRSMAEQMQKDLVWSCQEAQNANKASADTVDAVAKAKLVEREVAHNAKRLPEGQFPENTKVQDLSKRQQLMDLIRYVQMWEMTHEGQEMDLDTANALYDELYYAFKAYNDEQRKLGRWDRMIDKNDFLHAFNNRFIEPHEKSNALVSALRAPVAWITGNRMKRPSDAPHRRNRVKQRAATEKSWLMEVPAMTFRVLTVYGMGWSLVGTAALLPLAIPVAGVWSLGCAVLGGLQTAWNRIFKDKGAASTTWTKWTGRMRSGVGSIERVITFDAEKIPTPDWMKDSYAKNTRIAGTSSQHLDPEGKHILQQLESHEQEERDTPVDVAENVNDVQEGDHKSVWLDGYERKYANKTVFSIKARRQEEKTMLTRYATAMTDLEKRHAQLSARILRLDPSGNDLKFSKMRTTLTTMTKKIDDYKKNPVKNYQDNAKIVERLNFYYNEGLGNLNQIDKDLKVYEKAKVAELTGANKHPASATNGSGAAPATNSGVVKQDIPQTATPQEQIMSNNAHINNLSSRGVEHKDIAKMIDRKPIVAFLPVKNATTPNKDTTEVVDLANVYGKNEQFIRNFNDCDVQVNLGGAALTSIKGVLSADKVTMDLMICRNKGDTQDKWEPITEADLKSYLAHNSDGAKSLSEGAMRDFNEKLNIKNTQDNKPTITVAATQPKPQQQNAQVQHPHQGMS